MAGSCPVNLAVAVADAGGMGAMGALMSSPDAIAKWAAEFRSRSLGPFQLNLWIAEPAEPARDFAAEQRVREFLSSWAPAVLSRQSEAAADPAEASGIQFPDFETQCDSFLAIRPAVVSSMVNTSRGPIVVEADLIAALKAQRIAGAAIDVFDQEPLPLDHPFRTLANLLATPHIGYVSRGLYTRFYQDTVENIRRWLDGQATG